MSQLLAMLGMALAVLFLFLPYVRYLNRLAALNRVLLLQFPQSVLITAPSEVQDELKL